MVERHDDGYYGYLGTLTPDQQQRVRSFMNCGEDERWARMVMSHVEIKEAVEALTAKNPWATMARYGTFAGTIVGGGVAAAAQVWKAWH